MDTISDQTLLFIILIGLVVLPSIAFLIYHKVNQKEIKKRTFMVQDLLTKTYSDVLPVYSNRDSMVSQASDKMYGSNDWGQIKHYQ